ncbi:hypothetical protein ACEV7Z_23970, partial [Vibrio parahaemolyticus]
RWSVALAGKAAMVCPYNATFAEPRAGGTGGNCVRFPYVTNWHGDEPHGRQEAPGRAEDRSAAAGPAGPEASAAAATWATGWPAQRSAG